MERSQRIGVEAPAGEIETFA